MFLTSAYLLEPAHHAQQGKADPEEGPGARELDGRYGQARQTLPANVAQPFACVAEKLGQHPWLEYAYCYGPGNYVHKRTDLAGDELWHWTNLEPAFCFMNNADEIGFIAMHVQIVAKANQMIGGISDALGGVAEGDLVLQRAGLGATLEALVRMNASRREMWGASRPTQVSMMLAR